MLEKDRTAGRGKVIEALRAELLGPAAVGKPLDSFKFEKKEESYGPWINAATGEEILERDPLIRYGVGVLYPVGDATSPNIANQAIVPGLTAEKTEERIPGLGKDPPGGSERSLMTPTSNSLAPTNVAPRPWASRSFWPQSLGLISRSR